MNATSSEKPDAFLVCFERNGLTERRGPFRTFRSLTRAFTLAHMEPGVANIRAEKAEPETKVVKGVTLYRASVGGRVQWVSIPKSDN